MARVELHFSGTPVYTERVQLRTTDMSRSGHLGFDSLVGVLHHVLTRFFDHCGFPISSGGGVSYIVKDLAVIYHAEAHSKDVVSVAVGVGDRGEKWAELFFRVSRLEKDEPSAGPQAAKQVVALAKLAVICFDYDRGAAAAFPPEVRKAFVHEGR